MQGEVCEKYNVQNFFALVLHTCKNYGEGMNTKSEGEFSFCDLVSIMDEIRAGLSQSSASLMGHPLFL